MRLALFVLFLASSVAPHAQARFQAMCASNYPASDIDYDAVCACAVDRVLALGGTPANLDAVVDFMASGADLEDVPDEVVATSNAATAAVYACRSDAGIGGASDAALQARLSPAPDLEGVAQSAGDVPMTPEALAAEVSGQAALPPGIRTGNGTAPVQARQEGKGSAIRILE